MKDRLRLMIVGAHPDDAEFHAGGLMIRHARAGSRIFILSLTDGSAGHQQMPPAKLAARRLTEATTAARHLRADVAWLKKFYGERSKKIATQFASPKSPTRKHTNFPSTGLLNPDPRLIRRY